MRIALTLVLVAVAAAGCSDKRTSEPKAEAAPAKQQKNEAHPYTKREMRWLKKLVRWEKHYSAVSTSSKIDETYTAVLSGDKRLRALRKAVRPKANCARSMRTKLGEPPTERLQPAFGLFLQACEQDKKSADQLVRAFTSTRIATGDTEEDPQVEGEELLKRAHDSIDSMLLANRPLPIAGRMSKVSRIEPRLGRAVKPIAVRRVEIRCWSKRDWKRTVKEYRNYYGVKFDVAGFANPTKRRANIAPAFCNRLARFTYKHWRPAGGDALLDMAFSVGVLAHETEHLSNPVGSEAETECHGMQDVRRVARELGANRSYANRLADAYWDVIYPQEPKGYGTDLCHSGGPLDIDPSTNVWP